MTLFLSIHQILKHGQNISEADTRKHRHWRRALVYTRKIVPVWSRARAAAVNQATPLRKHIKSLEWMFLTFDSLPAELALSSLKRFLSKCSPVFGALWMINKSWSAHTSLGLWLPELCGSLHYDRVSGEAWRRWRAATGAVIENEFSLVSLHLLQSLLSWMFEDLSNVLEFAVCNTYFGNGSDDWKS